MQQDDTLSPGTPISRLESRKSPIGRLALPGSTAAVSFINTLLKIGYVFHGRIRALWRNRPCLNHCRNTKKRN